MDTPDFIDSSRMQAELARLQGEAIPVPRILEGIGRQVQREIAREVARHLERPWVDLDVEGLAPESVVLMPASEALRLRCIPVAHTAEQFTVAVADPTDSSVAQAVSEATGRHANLVVASSLDIDDALTTWYRPETVKVWSGDQQRDAQSTPVMGRVVVSILDEAVRVGADEIFIEPTGTTGLQSLQVRFRGKGHLAVVRTYPHRLTRDLIDRVKMMSSLDLDEKRLPQDGRVHIDLADPETGCLQRRRHEIYVSLIPTVWGERIVLRIRRVERPPRPLDDLGLDPRARERLGSVLTQRSGLVILTGPWGSGKTATLYSMMASLDLARLSVCSAEWPVEERLPGVAQTPCKPDLGLTYAATVRSLLRQCTDVIAVGEIRDYETAEIAVRSALTGHLVLTCMYSPDVVSTLGRLRDMGLENYEIATAVLAVQSQRLVRTLCDDCARPTPANQDILEAAGLTKELALRLGWSSTAPLRESVGCASCDQSGFRGLVGVFEHLTLTEAVKDKLRQGTHDQGIWPIARRDGMLTLREAALRHVLAGTTSLAEAIATTPPITI